MFCFSWSLARVLQHVQIKICKQHEKSVNSNIPRPERDATVTQCYCKKACTGKGCCSNRAPSSGQRKYTSKYSHNFRSRTTEPCSLQTHTHTHTHTQYACHLLADSLNDLNLAEKEKAAICQHDIRSHSHNIEPTFNPLLFIGNSWQFCLLTDTTELIQLSQSNELHHNIWKTYNTVNNL